MPMDRKLYPANWKDIALSVKEAAGWKCQKCGKQCRRPGEPFDTHKRTLTVAHLNHIPADVRPDNLMAMCAPCHLRYDAKHHTQKAERWGKREMTKEEIADFLEKHKHWWNEDCDGWEYMRADLSGAYLSGAYLRGAKGVNVPYACPDFGMFIGWKKAHGKIVCLEIPEDARRLSATGRKCRCDKAKVLNITKPDGSECDLTEVCSDYDKAFVYRVGETVTVDDFDENRWNECSTGIHFFINRQEAVDYR